MQEIGSTQAHLWGACLKEAIAIFEAKEVILKAELDSDERCRVSLELYIKMEEIVALQTRKRAHNQAPYLQNTRSYEHVKQQLITLDKTIAQN